MNARLVKFNENGEILSRKYRPVRFCFSEKPPVLEIQLPGPKRGRTSVFRTLHLPVDEILSLILDKACKQ